MITVVEAHVDRLYNTMKSCDVVSLLSEVKFIKFLLYVVRFSPLQCVLIKIMKNNDCSFEKFAYKCQESKKWEKGRIVIYNLLCHPHKT